MCVRPACYIPSAETISPAREHAARLIRRRNIGTVLELGAIALFLRMVWIWAALGAGA